MRDHKAEWNNTACLHSWGQFQEPECSAPEESTALALRNPEIHHLLATYTNFSKILIFFSLKPRSSPTHKIIMRSGSASFPTPTPIPSARCLKRAKLWQERTQTPHNFWLTEVQTPKHRMYYFVFLTPNLLLYLKPASLQYGWLSVAWFLYHQLASPRQYSNVLLSLSPEARQAYWHHIWQVKAFHDTVPHVATARVNTGPEAATSQTHCGWLRAAHPPKWKNAALPLSHHLRIMFVHKGLPWP